MEEHLPIPEIMGPHGRAWRTYPESLSVRFALVVSWIIEAKWAHPHWHSYVMSTIHLRDVEGMDPPRIYLPEATHEVVLYALNPEHPRRIYGDPHILTPGNFAAQFIEASDEDAEARVTESVREIVNGTLSPDTDWVREWIKRYGDNMIKPECRPTSDGETQEAPASPDPS